MTLSQGDRLGRYEILTSIGAGGMGEVWRARDTELGREVAIKVLPPQVADSPDRRKRFEREARATAALNHPNLLTVHDVGIDHDQPYIVTELLEGETLRRVLRHGPPPPVSAVAWSLGIAHGLAAAHSRNVVHRDLKPDNVFLTTDNRVKILDFGLAKILETEIADEDETAALSSDTAAGTLLGTMGYMAPEQLRGDPVDTRTDVFAFGCVLYEMLSGRRPFAGGSSADYVSAALRDDPAPLEDSLSVGLRAIVRRCLEKRPAARYQGAGELVAVLETLDPDSLGAVSGGKSAPAITNARSGAEPAVAVMPFANLSNDVEQEYFCDGMTEEILGAIGKIRGLRVLARSSSFAFKGQRTDPRKIGEHDRSRSPARGQHPTSRQPDPNRRSVGADPGRHPALGRPLRPHHLRHLRAPGRDLGGSRQPAPYRAAFGRTWQTATPPHPGSGGLRPLYAGSVSVEPSRRRRCHAGDCSV